MIASFNKKWKKSTKKNHDDLFSKLILFSANFSLIYSIINRYYLQYNIGKFGIFVSNA